MMSACFCPTVFHFSSGGATPEFYHLIFVLCVLVPLAEIKTLDLLVVGVKSSVCSLQ